MYSVYKITNKINGKTYIGSSIHVQKRWRQHINISKNVNSPAYNYPLYCAFRKYGYENFIFEIIKDDFENTLDMLLYEQSMIDFYDSTSNGYNQTRLTLPTENAIKNCTHYIEKHRQKCAKIDSQNNILEVYNSYHEAAEKNGYNRDDYASAVRDVCKGKRSSCFNQICFRDLDEFNQIIKIPFKNYKARKPLVGINIENPEEERYFESISAAAKELSSDRTSIEQCIQGSTRHSTVKGYILRELDINGNLIENNIDIDQKIEEYNNKNPLINGERHNLKEWCKIFNISFNSFNYRRKKGMSVIEALTTPKKGGIK